MSIVIVDDVARAVTERGIKQAVHFTTNTGMLGIAAYGSVLSRKRLPEAKRLELIYEPNAARRKDVEHLDYVNLSIDRINASFFNVSERWRWEKPDLYWCLLGFSPEILAHQDVLFATTNNMYTGVNRQAGTEGLDALYASVVTQWQGNVVRRDPSARPSWPTCRQAEVLYPAEVSLGFLRTVYVRQDEHADEVVGLLKTFYHDAGVDVVVDPDAFR